MPQPSSTATASADNIVFYSDRVPALKDGNYTISVTQKLTNSAPNAAIGVGPGIAPATQSFSIIGPRFSLDAQRIHSQFPPEGSLGMYDNVLPHVMIDRCTLPWERDPIPATAKANGTPTLPWLAVVVIDESELAARDEASPPPTKASVRLAKLQVTSSTAGNETVRTIAPEKLDAAKELFPRLIHEFGDRDANGDLPTARLLSLPEATRRLALPQTTHALAYTAHARGNADATFATVIATRLPRQGAKSTAFLVSLEGHYDDAGKLVGLQPGQNALFVVLTSWRFACLSDKHDFAGLLKHVDRGPLALPTTTGMATQTRKWLAGGSLAMPYETLQGDLLAAWYRGPLLPGNPSDQPSLPLAAKMAADLTRFDTVTGMVDGTYAVAWELGRQLMVSDKQCSLDLYHWKRDYAQQDRAGDSRLDHLPGRMQSDASPARPASLDRWLAHTDELRGIPFTHLVPDERMLPVESIRFFQIDPAWMDCLLAGAFTVGYVPGGNVRPPTPAWRTPGSRKVSGFLLRSSVVSGWPTLQIEGKPKVGPTLKVLREDRLSKNLLLVLFEGVIATLKIHLPPERLHFGLTKNGAGAGAPDPRKFTKSLRTASSLNLPSGKPSPSQVPGQVGDGRHLSLGELADSMREPLGQSTSAQLNHALFAVQMIEGVEQVTFTIET